MFYEFNIQFNPKIIDYEKQLWKFKVFNDPLFIVCTFYILQGRRYETGGAFGRIYGCHQ